MPRIEVNAAPCDRAVSDSSIRSASGGKVVLSRSTTAARTVVSLVSQPATPTIRSVVGIAANSAENARPFASSPPAAAP